MIKRLRCMFLLIALLGLCGPGLAAQDTAPPNILVVLVDDMRWDEFGAAGHPVLETPSIDRLAQEGVRFTEAFVSTPLCSPSR
ncbi:MAG: sulfatase-like hydrolase/transferase, partial [Gammaproteobacteria bacterium]